MSPLPESPKLPFYACLKGCFRDRLPFSQNTRLNCPNQIPSKMFLKRVLPKATWGYLSVLKDSINQDTIDLDKDCLKPEIKIKLSWQSSEHGFLHCLKEAVGALGQERVGKMLLMPFTQEPVEEGQETTGLGVQGPDPELMWHLLAPCPWERTAPARVWVLQWMRQSVWMFCVNSNTCGSSHSKTCRAPRKQPSSSGRNLQGHLAVVC